MGLRVRVVAPAGPVGPERLEAGLAALRARGCVVSLGHSVRHGWGHLAGSDEERAADLVEALCHPELDLVWAARGGFGGLRLLPLLDWGRLAACRTRPALVGYSDLTSLQNVLRGRLNWPCWHAPMAATELPDALDPLSAASLAGLLASCSAESAPDLCAVAGQGGWRVCGEDELAGCAARVVLQAPGFRQVLGLPAGQVWSAGRAAGPLAGGNLSVLTSLFGAWDGVAAGSILLLEDHGEYPFRLDRHLAQLRNAGVLASAAGVLLGSFLNCEEPDPDKATFSAEVLLRQYLRPLSVPVLAGLPFGHAAPRLSIPLHGRAVIETETTKPISHGSPPV